MKILQVVVTMMIAGFASLVPAHIFAIEKVGWSEDSGGVLWLEKQYSAFYDMQLDGDYIYLTGICRGSPGDGIAWTQGLSPYMVDSNAILMKINLRGEVIWWKTMGSTGITFADDLRVDSNGDVIIGGIFDNAFDIDPGPGEEIIENEYGYISYNTSFDCFTAKYDSDGNFMWAHNGCGMSVDIDEQDKVYATGFVNKIIAPNGVTIDESLMMYGYSNDNDERIRTPLENMVSDETPEDPFLMFHNGFRVQPSYDVEGNIFLPGFFYGTYDFDFSDGVEERVSRGMRDMFVASYTPELQLRWVHTFPETMDYVYEEITGVAVDPEGRVVFIGNYSGEIDLDPGDGVDLHAGGDMPTSFAVMYSGDGEFVWSHVWGEPGDYENNKPSDLVIDKHGNIYVCGFAEGNSDMCPGDDEYRLPDNKEKIPYVLKLTPDGAW